MIESARLAKINQETVDRSNMFYWQVDRPMDMDEFVKIFMERHNNFDKTSIVPAIERVLRETDAGYGDAHVAQLVGNSDYTSGSVNVNRLVVLDDGRELVLRAHPAGLRNGYFDAEAAAMNAARKYTPTPHILAVRHNMQSDGSDFMLMEKMPGDNMKNYLAEHSEAEGLLVRDMGRCMARLHQVEVDGFGFFDNDYARETGQLRGIHSSFRQHVLAALPENLNVLVDAKYITVPQSAKITKLLTKSELIDCNSSRLLHNDLADWNVLTDGRELTAILDWDECFAGDPIADIACWSLFFRPERLATFLEGYRELAELDADFDDKLHIYRLRYVVSKMSLRHRKSGLQKDSIMADLIEAGLQALKDESAYFDL